MTGEGLSGRLAPSPTGGLHVGHARTFLIAWLAVRSVGGRVVLRVEDIDAARVRPESIQGAIDDIRWLGLDWDEGPDLGGPNGPYLQSRRKGLYEEALARLRHAEAVYPCTCTRADVARMATAPHASDEGPSYPGTCSGRSAGDVDGLAGRPYAWRFRVPPGPVAWADLMMGPTEGDPGRVGGDFVVGRSSGEPSYQLAVVCDDAAMGIDQVVRGADLVPSTPRQILLDRALGLPIPRFGHVPLVVGQDGKRLAKRDGSIKLATLREGGVDPRRLIATLGASIGIQNLSDRADPAQMIGAFRWSQVPESPWITAIP